MVSSLYVVSTVQMFFHSFSVLMLLVVNVIIDYSIQLRLCCVKLI